MSSSVRWAGEAAGHVNLPVTKRDGTAGTLFLRSDAGLVKSHIIDGTDFVWLPDCLSLEGSSPPDNLDALIGRPVTDICADDLFAGLTVAGVTRMGFQRELLIEQPIHFVDLGAGRIWEERAAA